MFPEGAVNILNRALREKLSVVVSLIIEQNDYRREQAASAQAAAIKLGASVQIIYAN